VRANSAAEEHNILGGEGAQFLVISFIIIRCPYLLFFFVFDIVITPNANAKNRAGEGRKWHKAALA
jgi:hypothetical protein